MTEEVEAMLNEAMKSCFRCAQGQVPHFGRTETSKNLKWLHELGVVVELDGKKLDVITCLAPQIWNRSLEAPL